MTTNIYVLKLENDYYYVGKTNDLAKRFEEHKSGNGSTWTKIHKPLSYDKVIEKASPLDEDKITKEYMIKYGIDKVRGGSYVREKLTNTDINSLQREIWGAQNLCFKCGNKHFVKDCYAKVDVNGNNITNTTRGIAVKFSKKTSRPKKLLEPVNTEDNNDAANEEARKKCLEFLGKLFSCFKVPPVN